MATFLFDPPRFAGAPPHCPVHNLPAFDDHAALSAFLTRFCPGHIMDEVWTCDASGKLHHRGHFGGPSGASSGTSTRHESLIIPAEIRASIRRAAPRQMSEALARMGGRPGKKKQKEATML